MGFTPLPYQPIAFNYEIPCYVQQDEYQYAMDDSDITQIAFALEPCSDVMPIDGITVQSSDPNWTADVDTYTCDGGNGAITFELPVALNSQPLWKVELNITVFTSGELELVIPSVGSYVMTTNGLHTFYIQSSSALTTYQLNSVGFIGTLYIDESNPTWTVINTYNRVDVLDNEDNVIQTLSPTIVDNVAIYSIDWSEFVTNACYRVAFVDGCDSFAGSFHGICNGELTQDLLCWEESGAGVWSTTVGYATFWDLSGGSGAGVLTNSSVLEAGLTYSVSYHVLDMVAAQLRLRYKNADNSTVFIDGIRTAAGTYSFEFTPEQDGVIQIVCQQGTGIGEPSASIANINVTVSGGFEYSQTSPCICIGSQGTCGIKLSGCFSNTFAIAGVAIPNTLQFNLRIPQTGREPNAALFKKQYQSDSLIYRNSRGRTDINYFDLTTTKVLRVERQPEFIFDFIMLWLGFDEMYINNVSYRFGESQLPVINWDEKTGLGSADFIVSPVRELNKKVICGLRDQPCSELPPPNQLAGLLYENSVGQEFETGDGILE